MLPASRKLEAFSFVTVGPRPHAAPNRFWLRHEDISSILAALPKTVRHLQIDIHSFDRGSGSLGPDPFPSIRSLFSQLSNLRLRLSELCPAVLPGVATVAEALRSPNERNDVSFLDIQSIIIILSQIGRLSKTMFCNSLLNSPIANASIPQKIEEGRRLPQIILAKADSAFSNHTFHVIQRFSVLDTILTRAWIRDDQ
jgi:hypothetical protein